MKIAYSNYNPLEYDFYRVLESINQSLKDYGVELGYIIGSHSDNTKFSLFAVENLINMELVSTTIYKKITHDYSDGRDKGDFEIKQEFTSNTGKKVIVDFKSVYDDYTITAAVIDENGEELGVVRGSSSNADNINFNEHFKQFQISSWFKDKKVIEKANQQLKEHGLELIIADDSFSLRNISTGEEYSVKTEQTVHQEDHPYGNSHGIVKSFNIPGIGPLEVTLYDNDFYGSIDEESGIVFTFKNCNIPYGFIVSNADYTHEGDFSQMNPLLIVPFYGWEDNADERFMLNRQINRFCVRTDYDYNDDEMRNPLLMFKIMHYNKIPRMYVTIDGNIYVRNHRDCSDFSFRYDKFSYDKENVVEETEKHLREYLSQYTEKDFPTLPENIKEFIIKTLILQVGEVAEEFKSPKLFNRRIAETISMNRNSAAKAREELLRQLDDLNDVEKAVATQLRKKYIPMHKNNQ